MVWGAVWRRNEQQPWFKEFTTRKIRQCLEGKGILILQLESCSRLEMVQRHSCYWKGQEESTAELITASKPLLQWFKHKVSLTAKARGPAKDPREDLNIALKQTLVQMYFWKEMNLNLLSVKCVLQGSVTLRHWLVVGIKQRRERKHLTDTLFWEFGVHSLNNLLMTPGLKKKKKERITGWVT